MGLLNLFHHFIWILKGIKVFALVGKSGTGKSFRSQLVAQKYGIELIVDDGLLIRGQKILAGKSAKREKVFLTAIKTALFSDQEQRESVKKALEKESFARILILGTSIRMTKIIAERLGLPQPDRILQIEDVATQEEIEAAKRARDTEGKHIIPVPAIEVKRNYPHIFYESVKIFFRRSMRVLNKEKVFEKAVVRPEYSRRGRLAISETALSQMVMHCVNEFDPFLKVAKIVLTQDGFRYNLEIILDIPYGEQITGPIYDLQNYIVSSIEKFTGLILNEVSITIGSVRGISNRSDNNNQ